MATYVAALTALSAYRDRRGHRIAMDVAPVLAAYIAFQYIPAIKVQQRSTFFAALFAAKLLRIARGRRSLRDGWGMSETDDDGTGHHSQFSHLTIYTAWPVAAAALLPQEMQDHIHRWGRLILD